MLEKLYKKSEVWFAVVFIILYVIGNSIFIQVSENVGLEMVYTIPYNLVLLGIMFIFIGKNRLFGYYGIGKVKCKAGKLLRKFLLKNPVFFNSRTYLENI